MRVRDFHTMVLNPESRGVAGYETKRSLDSNVPITVEAYLSTKYWVRFVLIRVSNGDRLAGIQIIPILGSSNYKLVSAYTRETSRRQGYATYLVKVARKYLSNELSGKLFIPDKAEPESLKWLQTLHK